MAHCVGLGYEDAKTDEELLNEQIATLQSEKSALQQQIAEKDAQIADLQKQLEECQAGQCGGA